MVGVDVLPTRCSMVEIGILDLESRQVNGSVRIYSLQLYTFSRPVFQNERAAISALVKEVAGCGHNGLNIRCCVNAIRTERFLHEFAGPAMGFDRFSNR